VRLTTQTLHPLPTSFCFHFSTVARIVQLV